MESIVFGWSILVGLALTIFGVGLAKYTKSRLRLLASAFIGFLFPFIFLGYSMNQEYNSMMKERAQMKLEEMKQMKTQTSTPLYTYGEKTESEQELQQRIIKAEKQMADDILFYSKLGVILDLFLATSCFLSLKLIINRNKNKS